MNETSRLDRLAGYLSSDPTNASLLSDAVHAALELEGAARAREMLALAEPALRAGAQGRFLEASVLLAEQCPREARLLLEDLRDEGVDAAAIGFNLGLACLRMGDPKAAVAALEPLMSREDSPPAALSWLLRALQHAGRLEDADAAWRSAPPALRTPEATAVASLTAFDLGRLDEARQLSEQALAGGAETIESDHVGASAALVDGDFPRADALLAHALARAPGDGRLNATLGMARLVRGDFAGAEAALRDAVAAMPRHVGSWHALGWCQLAGGNLEGARASFETALALDRNFGETHGALAVVHLLSGDVTAVPGELDRARGLDPNGLALGYAAALRSGQALEPGAVRKLALRLFDARGLGAVRLLDILRR